MVSTVTVHMPHKDREFQHFAFVVNSVELTKVGKISYADQDKPCEFLSEVVAGIYGFTNKEVRNRFISAVNGASDVEIAYIAQIQTATEAVATTEKDQNG